MHSREFTTIEKNSCPFLFGNVQIASNALSMFESNQRPHIHVGVSTISHSQLSGSRAQLIQERIALTADNNSNGDRHAPLACRTKSCVNSSPHGQVNVSIWHDDHVILGPAYGLNSLAHMTRQSLEVPRDRHRPHKTHTGNLWMFDQSK